MLLVAIELFKENKHYDSRRSLEEFSTEIGLSKKKLPRQNLSYSKDRNVQVGECELQR